jgi:DNA-binding MurR/RpiR family transcriptional regulator
MTAVAESFIPLEPRIRSRASEMTAAESRIAQLILRDPTAVSRMTISELGASAGTSESTVVRMARTLGFSGYPELRLALAVAGFATETASTLPGDIDRGDELDVALAKLAAAEESALRATVSRIDVSTLRTVVDVIVSARRLDIYGVGISGLVANDLWQKLTRIGHDCHAYVEVHLALTSASLLGPGDVALAISHSGRISDVLDPMATANELGATTIAVTSQTRSPLARLAQHVLISAGREEPLRPGGMASRMSQLLVTDAIFIGVAQHDYDASLRALRTTTTALSSRRRRSSSKRR